MDRVHSGLTASIPTEQTEWPANNARLIAELQAVAIGIHLVGLNRLAEVMRPAPQPPEAE